jgi:ATPase family AAA domain-containing protein 3A/B
VDDMAKRVSQLSVSTRNTKANSAPFRHIMFYGPPGELVLFLSAVHWLGCCSGQCVHGFRAGTGKTMVAKRLARSAGLDYAIMTGGDVGPLGPDAVTQLHKLFDWSEASSRGLLLFIDEADAFLGKRSRHSMSENHRNALNALLYRTGEASKHFMLVLATNRPEDLDTAVTDRVDESMHFVLPNKVRGVVRLSLHCVLSPVVFFGVITITISRVSLCFVTGSAPKNAVAVL